MDDHTRVVTLVEELVASHPPAETSPETFWGAQYDLGLAWVHFPEGSGGLGVDSRLQDVVDDLLATAGAPSNLLRNMIGVGQAANTLMAHGSSELRQQMLRPIFTCEEIWCQLFSEPGAGSDLASLATSAERDGDEWIVNGQKVWTTLAHIARWGLLLARSNPEEMKHTGLTYFILDMHTPGVEVRPLRQMTGEAEFNEVYFTDVRIPDALRLGQAGDGWRVALSTLMTERGMVGGLAKLPRGEGQIRHAVRLLRELEAPNDVMRARAIQAWIQAEVLRLTTIRAEAMQEQGIPGPEASILKLAWAKSQQEVFGLCEDLLGATGMLISDYVMTRPETALGAALGEGDDFDITKAFLNAQGYTIAGGTTDIMRNILAERVLGFPTDPAIVKGVPWNLIPRN